MEKKSKQDKIRANRNHKTHSNLMSYLYYNMREKASSNVFIA